MAPLAFAVAFAVTGGGRAQEARQLLRTQLRLPDCSNTDSVSAWGITCAVRRGDWVKCWGGNADGQLGQGDNTERGKDSADMGDNLLPIDLGMDQTATEVSVGERFACSLLSSGGVKCWGYNNYGQLGYGDTLTRGSLPNQMGDNLPTVDLGSGRTAKQIAAGKNHACALLDDDSLKCWGFGSKGQLGQGGTTDIGKDEYDLGDNLTAIDLGSAKILAVGAGAEFTCALLGLTGGLNGMLGRWVKCWGSGADGRTGRGDTGDTGKAPGEMGIALAVVNLGANQQNQQKVTQLSVGAEHTCVRLGSTSESIKCWGNGNYGALGNGATGSIGSNSDQMGDFLKPVDLGSSRAEQMIVEVTAGRGRNTCAVMDNGEVLCWGDNFEGQLGLGSMDESIGGAADQMGNNLEAANLSSSVKSVTVGGGGAAHSDGHTCAVLSDNRVMCFGTNKKGQSGNGNGESSIGAKPEDMGENLVSVHLGACDRTTTTQPITTTAQPITTTPETDSFFNNPIFIGGAIAGICMCGLAAYLFKPGDASAPGPNEIEM